MRCVNQNGGYLCLPRTAYNQQYRPEIPELQEPAYPDTSQGFPDTFLPAPRSVEPSYPRVGSTAQCLLGYTPAEDGTCNGESNTNYLKGSEVLKALSVSKASCSAEDVHARIRLFIQSHLYKSSILGLKQLEVQRV